MNEPRIENGFATVGAGVWLTGRDQPAAVRGVFSTAGLKGFIVPDRRELAVLDTGEEAYLASAERPFLTHIPSTGSLTCVSSKVLVAPLASRSGARLLKAVPFAFKDALAVTRFSSQWVVTATASRLRRIVLAEGEVVCVKRTAAVAWTGNDPVGVAGRVRLKDLFIPRRNVSLAWDFYGPQTIWVEGSHGV